MGGHLDNTNTICAILDQWKSFDRREWILTTEIFQTRERLERGRLIWSGPLKFFRQVLTNPCWPNASPECTLTKMAPPPPHRTPLHLQNPKPHLQFAPDPFSQLVTLVMCAPIHHQFWLFECHNPPSEALKIMGFRRKSLQNSKTRSRSVVECQKN